MPTEVRSALQSPSYSQMVSQHPHQPLICVNPRPKSAMKNQRLTLTRSAPVVITLALIQSLSGLSLPRAAGLVGVSTTAFKRACRRLGIRCWAFKRGKGKQKSAARKNMERPRKTEALPVQSSNNEDLCNTSSKYDICADGGWKQAEWEGLADGCRALADDWLQRIAVVSAKCSWSESFGTEPAVEADNRLVLDMLAQAWLLEDA